MGCIKQEKIKIPLMSWFMFSFPSITIGNRCLKGSLILLQKIKEKAGSVVAQENPSSPTKLQLHVEQLSPKMS